jgi:hypothetical protein
VADDGDPIFSTETTANRALIAEGGGQIARAEEARMAGKCPSHILDGALLECSHGVNPWWCRCAGLGVDLGTPQLAR